MSNVTRLQGSIFVSSYFQIKVIHDPSGAASAGYYTSHWDHHPNISPDYYPSVDDFMVKALTAISAGVGVTYTHDVITSGANKGKIRITTGDSKNFSLAWGFSGSASEAALVRNFLGESGDLTNVASPYIFTSAHKAGFYPNLAASVIRRSTTSHNRGAALRLNGSSGWTQHDTVADDVGATSVDLTLQLDTRTDWSEIYEFLNFCNDVLNEMGEPFTVTHGVSDDMETAEANEHSFTGFFSDSPLEVFPEQRTAGFSDVFTVSIALDGARVPAV